MRIVAVNGWGLGPAWFRDQVQQAFPGAAITVIQPAAPSGLAAAEPADLYLGYSLGSLVLLQNQHLLPAAAATKALLAPILAFPSEKAMGGRVSATQLRYLMRALGRSTDPRPILRAFHRDAGLILDDIALVEAPPPAELVSGLETLLNATAAAPGDFLALLGEHDPLLDSVVLQKHLPHLQILPHSGHAPLPLLKKLATLMPG